MKVDRQLLLLAASTVVVLVLGTFAFLQSDPAEGWLTALYKAVQLFSMNSGVIGDGMPTPVALEFARWLALGTLIAAVYGTVQALLGHLRSKFRIAFIEGHHIVCGAGKRGIVIARSLRSKVDDGKGKVVVVELDENNAALGELRNLGIDVVIGNALDAAVLQSAGVAKARSLVAVTGGDEKNLSICSEVKENLNSFCELHAGVESWAWRSFFLDRMKPGIRLESYLSQAARSLMLNFVASEAAREPAMRENGVRIVIEASLETRQELLRAAILTLQISGEKKPTIDVTSVAAGEEDAFFDRFPSASLVAELRWHRASASQVFPEGGETVPDFAVFSLGSDIETLEAAERFWMRHETPDHRIIACLDEDNEAAYMGSIVKKSRDIQIENLIKFGLGSKHPLEPDIDERAMKCHAIYVANERAKNPQYGNKPGDLPDNWAELKERYKESNRLAAAQIEVASIAWRTRGETPALQMLTHLARCEHMRWMAEKAMFGWRWSGSLQRTSRDDLKLKHNLLIPYAALTSPEKDKDFNTFLWALDTSDEELHALGLDEKTLEMVRFSREVRV